MRTPEAVLIVTVLASTLGLGAGCMGRAEGPSTDVAGVSLVRVGLSFTRGQASEARFGAEAHFVRLRGTDTPWVAAVLGLPGDEAIPLDSCRLVDRARELSRELDRAFNNDAKSTVELLDAVPEHCRNSAPSEVKAKWESAIAQLSP